jgi:hypothetical protein
MFVDICEDDADAYWLTLRFLAANQLAVILAEPVVRSNGKNGKAAQALYMCPPARHGMAWPAV